MRAKKKKQINFERKEKLIHKETMRFLNILENTTSTKIISQPYFSELYENIANHIREYLDNPNFEKDHLRGYLQEENNKIKNLFIDENNTEETLSPPNIKSEENLFNQTIFNIAMQSDDKAIEREKKELEDKLLNNEKTNDNKLKFKTLEEIKQNKFSNLTALEINSQEYVKNKDNNFVTLSKQPFLFHFLSYRQKPTKKINLLRKIKYLYLKIKRHFK